MKGNKIWIKRSLLTISPLPKWCLLTPFHFPTWYHTVILSKKWCVNISGENTGYFFSCVTVNLDVEKTIRYLICSFREEAVLIVVCQKRVYFDYLTIQISQRISSKCYSSHYYVATVQISVIPAKNVIIGWIYEQTFDCYRTKDGKY